VAILREFERRLGGLVEGLFAKTFRSGLQPVELAKRVLKEMDAGRSVGVSEVWAPNAFVFRLSPSDAEHFQQAAGLVLYYNATKFHYLYLTEDETTGRHLRVMSCLTDVGDSFSAPIPLPAGTHDIELRADVDFERLVFSYRLAGDGWRQVPQVFDASIVADESGPPTLPNFTGAFVGICCQDGTGTALPADFDYFEYLGRDYQAVYRGPSGLLKTI